MSLSPQYIWIDRTPSLLFIDRLQFGLIVALLFSNIPAGNAYFQITTSVGDYTNIEQYAYFSSNSRVSLERQRTRSDVGIQIGVGKHPIRHKCQRQVHDHRVTGANFPGRNGDLTHHVASVF